MLKKVLLAVLSRRRRIMLWQSLHDRHLEDYDFEDPEDLDDLAFMDALRDPAGGGSSC